MSKQFWAIVAVIVILLVGVSIVTRDKSDTDSGSTVGATNHVTGKGTTGVTLVEYGDYQCPYCQTYNATIKSVLAEYGDQITFQYANFPITNIHQNAYAAARAAEAAGLQGKFWEMHDLLYEGSDPNGRTGWVASNAPSSFFEQYATRIGLDIEKFKTDVNSVGVNNAIKADIAKAEKLDVTGTPAFFINGKKVTIANTLEDFKKVIDEAIAKEKAGDDSAVTSSGTTEQSTEVKPEETSNE